MLGLLIISIIGFIWAISLLYTIANNQIVLHAEIVRIYENILKEMERNNK